MTKPGRLRQLLDSLFTVTLIGIVIYLIVDGVQNEPNVEPAESDPIVETFRVCTNATTKNEPNKWFEPTALDEYVWRRDDTYRQGWQCSSSTSHLSLTCHSSFVISSLVNSSMTSCSSWRVDEWRDVFDKKGLTSWRVTSWKLKTRHDELTSDETFLKKPVDELTSDE